MSPLPSLHPAGAAILTLREARRPIRLEDYRLRHAQDTDCSRLVDEPFVLYEGGSPEITLAYLKVEDPLEDLRAALHRIRYDTSFRSGGLKTHSRTIGFLPRVPFRRDWCTSTSLSMQQPQEHLAVARATKIIESMYRSVNQRLYDFHYRLAHQKVKPEWLISHGVFTSGIVNENNQLKYHFDAGNFDRVWSAMIVFKEDIEGGYLSLPEFGMKVACRDRTIFLFDGQGILHGVTPFTLLKPEGRRYSIVWYSMQGMWQCQPIGDELSRARGVRTEREGRERRMP